MESPKPVSLNILHVYSADRTREKSPSDPFWGIPIPCLQELTSGESEHEDG